LGLQFLSSLAQLAGLFYEVPELFLVAFEHEGLLSHLPEFHNPRAALKFLVSNATFHSGPTVKIPERGDVWRDISSLLLPIACPELPFR
jgi:hypothetical protein